MKLEDRNLIFVDKQDKQDRRLRYPWRCTNKIQRNGENRELPTPPSNRKVMEAEVVVGRVVIGGAFTAVSDMFEIYTGDLNVTIRVRTALGPLGACCCLLQ